MSDSFKQFLSTLGAHSAAVETPQLQSVESDGNENIDITGKFSPILLYDPTTEKDLIPSQSYIAYGDSPGGLSCVTSSNNTSKVFSKAEEFISATLSNVKIGECGISSTTASNDLMDGSKDIANIDSIKECKSSAHTALNDLIGIMENGETSCDPTGTTLSNIIDNETVSLCGPSDPGAAEETNEGVGKNVEPAPIGSVPQIDSNLDFVREDDVDSKSALNTPYLGNKSKEERSNSISDNKVWREGMEKQTGESSKTMFMSQNLTQMYDRADAEVKGTTYKAWASKISREMVYFVKMLNMTAVSLQNTEYTLDSSEVLSIRDKMKEKIEEVKLSLNDFAEKCLEGEVRDKAPSDQVPEPRLQVKIEYVYPPEKKSAKEAKAELCLENVDVGNSLHKCVDCLEYVTIGKGETLEFALERHSNSARHKKCMKVTAEPADKSDVQKQQQKEKADNNKKALDKVRQNVLNHTQSRQMMLNQMTSKTVNGIVMLTCNPCNGVTIAVDAFGNHVNTNAHKENLNNFNMKLQKELIVKYPDLFGPSKMFELTDIHTVMNKIFVDPLAKYAYCGLCRKELPLKQTNIDEHITSKQHERLLLTSMEGNVSKIQQKEVDQLIDSVFDSVDMNSFKQRSQENRRSSGTIQPCYDLEEKDKIYGATSRDGKFVCLLCDARGITSVQNLVSHINGGPHKTNLEHAKQPRGGLDPATQLLFIANMVSVTYGRFPLIFECFACYSPPFAGLQGAMDHINTLSHTTMLQQKKLKNQQSKIEGSEQRRSNIVTNVILHRNGTTFWCLSCRCELSDISSAYHHVLLPGHLTASVDGVSMLQGTQFYCEHCSVLINGEKNVGQHIVSQRHRQQAALVGKTNSSRDSKTPPSTSKVHPKKTEDERNGNKLAALLGEDIKTSEQRMMRKNFIVNLKKNGFQCKLCDSEPMNRANIITHIFSYEHAIKMQSQTMANNGQNYL